MQIDDDDWEKPEEFWQVLQVGGFCHNLDRAGRDEVMAPIGTTNAQKLVPVVDIYGDEAYIVPAQVVGIKQYTLVGGRRWERSRGLPGFDE